METVDLKVSGQKELYIQGKLQPYIVCNKRRSSYSGGEGAIIWSNGLMVQYNWDSANCGTSITRSWRFPFSSENYAVVFVPTGNDEDTGGWGNLEVVLNGGSSSGYYYGRKSTGYRLSNSGSSIVGYCVIAIGECSSSTLSTYLANPSFDF